MKRAGCLLLMVTALTGCAAGGSGSPWLAGQASDRPAPCAAPSSDQELVLNLSREMLEGGRLHAALANLERLPDELPEARLGKARILRLLGRSEAQELYRSLLGGCLTAEGFHGLGQLAAAGQRYEEALEHLQRAIRLAPTNHALRNDLGVVYLNLKRMREARFELMTAMELNEQENRAAQNLLTLLIHEGQWSQAGRLVTRYKFTPAQFAEAEQRARMLQQKGGLQAAEVGATEESREDMPAAAPAPTSETASVPVAAALVPTVASAPAAQPPARTGGVQRVESSGARPVVPITGIEDRGVTAR